ncbi:MAG: hypothetical protein KIT11_05200 [Fimbriimonadaceae bacterium]|nr:hypothetical protein [Fimbriimonadaceae bacterium]QYK56710.1 MAG: hypothetical protein KF733_04320 [Fimbriimonadaceae bacterium]
MGYRRSPGSPLTVILFAAALPLAVAACRPLAKVFGKGLRDIGDWMVKAAEEAGPSQAPDPPKSEAASPTEPEEVIVDLVEDDGARMDPGSEPTDDPGPDPA